MTPSPLDEDHRVAILRRYAVLDETRDEALDDLTSLAADLCDAPYAVVSLLDADRQWFKSRAGLTVPEPPRAVSFCQYAIDAQDLFIVTDASKDPRFSENPIVTQEPKVRFYAGARLVSPEGAFLGVLCVLDCTTRSLTPRQERALRVLARQVMINLDLHRQQRELTASEQRLFAFMQHNPAVTWIVDGDGTMHYVSPSYCNKLGGVPSDYVGRKLQDLFEPEMARAYLQKNAVVIDERRSLETVDPGRRKDGSVGHFLTVKFPIDGPTPLVGGMAIDVTERKEVEDALRASEARFNSVFRSNPAAVGLSVLETGRIVDANDRICAFFGKSREELIGKTIAELGSWAYPEQRLPLLEKVRAAGSVHDADVQLRRHDGEIRHVLASLERVEILGEREPLLVTMFIDVTEQKRAALELQKSTSLITAIADGTSDAIFVKDTGGHYLFVNESCAQMLGRTVADMVGKADAEIFNEETSQLIVANDRRVMEAGVPRVLEEKLTMPAGVRTFSSMKTPYRDALGNVVGLIGIARDITQQKQSESQLKILETCIARLGDMVLIAEAEPQVESEPRIIFVNDAFAKITGYLREEVLGRPLRFLQGPKTNREELDRIRIAMSQWRPVRAELINYKKNGEEFWVELDIAPVADATGRFTHWVSVERDVTRRKRSENALRASEERYRALVDHAPDGIVMTDHQGHILDANASACAMLHGARSELIGISAARFLIEKEIPHFHQSLADLRKGSTTHGEWQVRRSDGSIFEADVISTGMPDGNTLSMVRDITDRKRSEVRFRHLVQSNIQGVHFWNSAGKIMEANDAFLQIIGYSRTDLHAGRINWVLLTPIEFADLDEYALKEMALTGACTPYEKELLRKDGTRVPILVGAATFADNPEEGVSFVLDLTERKKIEKQFLRAQRVESIGTLSNGIAHDLNNVFGPILLSLSVLNQRMPDEVSQKMLSVIESSTRHGATMVEQLLSYARGVDGIRGEVQLSWLIDEVRRVAEDTFLKNITLEVSFPQDLWSTRGDPTQLRQILLNLSVNARDAMPEGGRLLIAAENIHIDSRFAAANAGIKPGPHVRLSIEDTGVGIAPDIMEQIFDPFFTTKKFGEGTGLGLSSTLSIVKSHGGIIRVYSEPGRGSRFDVYLPAITTPPSAVAPQATVKMPRGHGELVLVVDDEAGVRQSAQHALEAFGYQVVLARHGEEAVTIYAQRAAEIAVVLTDMMMPVMDGPATINALLQINPNVPIIAASGLTNSAHFANAAKLGVQHFLSKPYSAAALLTKLKELLRAGE